MLLEDRGVCMHAKSLQSCLTLWDPVDWSPPGSSVHGILQARILEWVAMTSSRGSFWPRDQTCISFVYLLHWQEGSLAPPGKSLEQRNCVLIILTCQVFGRQETYHVPSFWQRNEGTAQNIKNSQEGLSSPLFTLLYSFKCAGPKTDSPTQPSVERGRCGNSPTLFTINAVRNQNELREAEAMTLSSHSVWSSH